MEIVTVLDSAHQLPGPKPKQAMATREAEDPVPDVEVLERGAVDKEQRVPVNFAVLLVIARTLALDDPERENSRKFAEALKEAGEKCDTMAAAETTEYLAEATEEQARNAVPVSELRYIREAEGGAS